MTIIAVAQGEVVKRSVPLERRVKFRIHAHRELEGTNLHPSGAATNMTIKYDMDQHVPKPLTDALRSRGIDVLTTQDDGTEQVDDAALLDRATGLGRVLFSLDKDFQRETASRQQAGVCFAGVITAVRRRVAFREILDDLELIATLQEPADLANQIVYLPF